MNAPGSILQVDSVVSEFMLDYNIPGMSIAIAKDGKMIYTKGYGYIDKSSEKEVTPGSLFRIGSASMSMTALAIMKLIEDGKLKPASRLFGDSGILNHDYGNLPYNLNLTAITVDELLHHTAGGWSNNDDVMQVPKYRDNPFSKAQLLTIALDNIPLRWPPDSAFAYSAFGYFLLGRVIEKLSGRPYADYVKESVLRPLGIYDMQIEGNSPENRRKNEAIGYKDMLYPIFSDEEDDDLYASISRADACFGWIATTKDLLRILVKVDRSGGKGGLLDSATMRIMLSGSKANPHFACGWMLNSDLSNWFYLGDYFGATTEMAHTTQGFCWVILVNTSRPAIDGYLTDMDQILWKVINNPATRWPDKDLFRQ
ncbi:MAG TPA: serine hydrolase domain-containing protein [Puia sp.]|jgi:CubicO group peptidase (beta-lactamase class C family)|nr:serine hydrolase domain-containing protein [Puia sp.]